jgi:hypothetical protein
VLATARLTPARVDRLPLSVAGVTDRSVTTVVEFRN